MKIIYGLFIVFLSVSAYAATPSTSCPSGYLAITQNSMNLTSGVCSSGYTSVGTVTSCLVASPDGVCMMYVPSGITYSDDTGTYEYTDICPLN